MGGDWGIYRGDCILIPAFPPVTPFQVNRKNHNRPEEEKKRFLLKEK